MGNAGAGKATRLARRSAAKTGTTDEYRDAWFIGFTSDVVVGVWVGNDDNSPMDRVAGGDIPARIWHDFVGGAEKLLAKPPAPAPGALTGSAAPPQSSSRAPVLEAQQSDAVKPAALTQPTQQPVQPVRGVPMIVDTG